MWSFLRNGPTLIKSLLVIVIARASLYAPRFNGGKFQMGTARQKLVTPHGESFESLMKIKGLTGGHESRNRYFYLVRSAGILMF